MFGRHTALIAMMAVLTHLAAGRPAEAARLYVSASAPGPVHDGSSWPTAFVTVQAAINGSISGDDVWVAATPVGPYRELITLKDGVRVLGGYTGCEASEAERNPSAHVTTLEGVSGGPVVTAVSCTARTTLDGFTITNGSATGSGGGIRCVSGRPTITNNIIRSNGCVGGGGGGIACESGAAPFISRNTISANTSLCGAGIWCKDSSPSIADNIISGNNSSANGYGGGVYCLNSSPLIRHNVISNNSASAYGGGIGISGGGPTIVGNTVSGNTASGYGGGIACNNGYPRIVSNIICSNATDVSGGAISFVNSSATVVNNTFAGNIAPQYGAAVDLTDNTGNVANNVVAFNTTGVILGAGSFSTNCVFGNSPFDYAGTDPTLTSGNTSADPMFVDKANGNYALTLVSPCRDTGDDLAIMPGDTDALDHPRIQGPHVERGAVEVSAAVGYRWWDVANALRIAGGLCSASALDKAWLNGVTGTSISLRDAMLLARKAAGLDINQ